jgi:hypothetical protein
MRYIYFKQDPHLRVVAIMTEQKAIVELTTSSDAIWAISKTSIRWLKDTHKHANSSEWQTKYYKAVDNYVDELNELLDIFEGD